MAWIFVLWSHWVCVSFGGDSSFETSSFSNPIGRDYSCGYNFLQIFTKVAAHAVFSKILAIFCFLLVKQLFHALNFPRTMVEDCVLSLVFDLGFLLRFKLGLGKRAFASEK